VKRLACVVLLAACGHAPLRPGVPGPSAVPSAAAADESFREHAPDLGPELGFDPPDLAESRLPNGIRVIASPYTGGVVGIAVVLKGKASYSKESPGMIELAMSALFDATKSRDGDAIRKTFDEGFAQWSYQSGDDALVVTLRAVKTKHLADCIDVLADVVENSLLNEQALSFALPPLAQAARNWADDPDAEARIAVMRELYGDAHPYAQLDQAGLEKVSKIDEKAVRRMFDGIAQPANTTILLVGALDDAVRAKVAEDFGHWSVKARSTASPVPPPSPKPHPRLIVIDRPGAPQSHIAIGALGPARDAEDWPVLIVLDELLGARPTSHMSHELFDRNLIVSGGTTVYPHARASLLLFEATSVAGRTADALAAVATEIEDLGSSERSREDIAAVETQYLREIPDDFEDSAGMLDELTSIPAYGLPLDAYQRLFAAIRTVDPGDVRRLAEERLRWSKLATVVVGDWKKLEPSLAALDWGAIDVRDQSGKRKTP
jgi:zinc protease